MIVARGFRREPLEAVIRSPLLGPDGSPVCRPGQFVSTDDVLLGWDEDGTPVVLNLAYSAHALVAGLTRSGKSITVNTLLAYASLMRDVRLIVIDPNLGAVAPWWRTACKVSDAIHPDEPTEILRRVREEMQRRERLFWSGRTDRITEFHSVLESALEHAVREDEPPRNIARNVKTTTHQPRRFQPLTAAEARQLLDAARADRLQALYELALRTGLRKGELFGLHWEDLDLTNRNGQHPPLAPTHPHRRPHPPAHKDPGVRAPYRAPSARPTTTTTTHPPQPSSVDVAVSVAVKRLRSPTEITLGGASDIPKDIPPCCCGNRRIRAEPYPSVQSIQFSTDSFCFGASSGRFGGSSLAIFLIDENASQ